MLPYGASSIFTARGAKAQYSVGKYRVCKTELTKIVTKKQMGGAGKEEKEHEEKMGKKNSQTRPRAKK